MNYRNQKILDNARSHSCQFCGRANGTIVAAHSNQQRHGKGMGIKASDIVAYLCYDCHTFVDRSNTSGVVRENVWEIAAIRSLPLYWHLLDQEGRDEAERVLGKENLPKTGGD